MDIFSLIYICGGLAFFLYGMQLLSYALGRLSGGKLPRLLQRMTGRPVKSLALGAGLTVALQSSSALTVILVGLVNSGVMGWRSTRGLILGANIGTTLTPWMLSLAGVSGNDPLLRLLQPSSFSSLVAMAGVMLLLAGRRDRPRDRLRLFGEVMLGEALLGLAILMSGMTLMSDAMAPLAQAPGFTGLLTAFSNPLLALLIAALFTGVIQSSAAAVGVLQALSLTQAISWHMALPLIMGLNIGTCVTAYLSGIGVSPAARQVARFHIRFNVIGASVLLSLWRLAEMVFPAVQVLGPIDPVGVALAHTLFNLLTAGMFLPFIRRLP